MVKRSGTSRPARTRPHFNWASSVIAELTGITRSRFPHARHGRRRQGAPLVPYVDTLLLTIPRSFAPRKTSAALRMSRFFPLSPASGAQAFAFDTGPAIC